MGNLGFQNANKFAISLLANDLFVFAQNCTYHGGTCDQAPLLATPSFNLTKIEGNATSIRASGYEADATEVN